MGLMGLVCPPTFIYCIVFFSLAPLATFSNFTFGQSVLFSVCCQGKAEWWYLTPQVKDTRQEALCRPDLYVRLCEWVFLLRYVCVWERVNIVQLTESIKGITKMCLVSLTVVQCWSSEYYGCHYHIAKAAGHVTHHPTQTVHSKQHLIPCLTAHHCPLGGIWATANGLPLIIKVLSQMSRKYYTYRICQTLTKHHTLENIGQIQMSCYSWRMVPRTNKASHGINRTDTSGAQERQGQTVTARYAYKIEPHAYAMPQNWIELMGV